MQSSCPKNATLKSNVSHANSHLQQTFFSTKMMATQILFSNANAFYKDANTNFEFNYASVPLCKCQCLPYNVHALFYIDTNATFHDANISFQRCK